MAGLRMELFHPGIANIDCEDCKRFIYNLKTGERETFLSGPKREEKPKIRHPGMPMQCDQCPKGSPANDKACRLSAKNRQTVWLYKEIRAGAGMPATMRRDELLRFNLTIVDGIYREWEREQLCRGIANSIVPWLPWIRIK